MQTHFTSLHYINQQEDEKPSSPPAPAPCLGLLVLGGQGRQGWAPQQLPHPTLKGDPAHPPPGWDPRLLGHSLRAPGTGKTVLLEVPLKKNEGCWWICNQLWACRMRGAAEFSVTSPICWLIALIKILELFLLHTRALIPVLLITCA